jgi:hypothetical protein
MCPFLTISLSIYHSRVEYRFAVKKCDHITQGPAYLTLTTIFGSKKTGGTLWLLMLGEGVLVPSPKFWVQKSRWSIWKSKLAWFSISIATSVPVILTTRGQQSAPSQLPLWGKSKLWLMESNYRPLHIWDWEPVTIPLSSTLIGGKGGAGPCFLHTTLEGPTEHVNARWMYCLRGFPHGIDWIMFHGHLVYFPKTTSWR